MGTTMKTIFDIDADMQRIADLLDEWEGEIPPELEPEITRWMNSLGDEFTAELHSYSELMLHHKTQAAIARAQIDMYAKKESRHKLKFDWLEEQLQRFMTMKGYRKLPTNGGRTFTLCNNGGKQPVQYDEVAVTEVPVEHRKVTVELNKEAIRRDLEQGKELPYARLLPRGQHVRLNVV